MPYIGADVEPLHIPNPLPFQSRYVATNGKLGKAHNVAGRGFGDHHRDWLKQLSCEEIGDLWRVVSRSVRPKLPAQRFPDSRILFSYGSNINLDALNRGRQFAISLLPLETRDSDGLEPFQGKIIALSTSLPMRSQSFVGRFFMMKRVAVPAILAVSAAVLFVTLSVAQSDKPAKSGMNMGDTPATQPSGKLTKMESPKRVCMVTNKAFEDDQIAVEVGGKTYYGCCEMCKGRLTSDAKLRSAVDPVSQKPVDKAEAVIAADSKGKVFYFENDENLAAYNAKVAK
jgi:YHS domain-containing protein